MLVAGCTDTWWLPPAGGSPREARDVRARAAAEAHVPDTASRPGPRGRCVVGRRTFLFPPGTRFAALVQFSSTFAFSQKNINRKVSGLKSDSLSAPGSDFETTCIHAASQPQLEHGAPGDALPPANPPRAIFVSEESSLAGSGLLLTASPTLHRAWPRPHPAWSATCSLVSADRASWVPEATSHLPGAWCYGSGFGLSLRGKKWRI